MATTRTVTTGKTSSQASERARIVAAAAAQRARTSKITLKRGGKPVTEVRRRGASGYVVESRITPAPAAKPAAPAQTPKPPPPAPVVKPGASAPSIMKSQLILVRKDGTRIMTGSNVVNEGDTIFLTEIGATPNSTVELVYGDLKLGNGIILHTNAQGAAHTTLTMTKPGNIGVNVVDRARGHTDAVTVWVQAKAAPAPAQQMIPVNQTVTPPTAEEIVNFGEPTPDFLKQLGEAGEQAKVGFGGFGVGVLLTLGLGAVLLLRGKR